MDRTLKRKHQILAIWLWLTLATVLLLPGVNVEATAQCPMCRTSLENSQEGQLLAQGINSGILFLLSVPFAVAAVIAAKIYAAHRRHSPLPAIKVSPEETFTGKPGAQAPQLR